MHIRRQTYFILTVLLITFTFVHAQAQAQAQPPRTAAEQQKYERALKLFEQMGKLDDAARSDYSKGNIVEARERWQSGLDIARAHKLDSLIAVFVANVSLAEDAQGNYFVALDDLNEALAINRRLNLAPDVIGNLTNVGTTYIDLGEYVKARDSLNDAMKMNTTQGDAEVNAKCLIDLGVVYAGLGQYGQALDAVQRATEAHKSTEPGEFEESEDSILGTIYLRLGLFDLALGYDEDAYRIAKSMGNRRTIASALHNLGNCKHCLGHDDKALENYISALKLRKAIGNEHNVFETLNNIGVIYLSQRKFQATLDLFDNEGKQEPYGSQRDLAESETNIGVALFGLKRYPAAIDKFNSTLGRWLHVGNNQDIAAGYVNIGAVYFEQGDYQHAVVSFGKAQEAEEFVSKEISDPSQLGEFQATMGDLYGMYALTWHRLKQPMQALLTLERGRGQGLARQIRLSDEDTDELFSSAEATELRRLSQSMAMAEDAWRRAEEAVLVAKSADERSAAQDAATKAEDARKQSERQYALFRQALFARYPHFSEIGAIDQSMKAQILAMGRRNPDTLYVEWGEPNNNSTLLVSLTKDGVQSYELPIGKIEFRQRLDDWRLALLTSVGSPTRLAAEKQQGKKLYQLLFGPLMSSGALARGKHAHIVLIGNSLMHDVPLSALVDGDGKRLVDWHAVSTSLSLRLIDHPDSYRDPTRTILCVADPLGVAPTKTELKTAYQRAGAGPLPGAREEGYAIADLFRSHSILVGPEATKGAVRKEIGEYAIIHIATHGYLEPTEPLNSGLVLAKDSREQNDDGFLSGNEVVKLKLSARLVVLSACGSGGGQAKLGDGILGLAWAFRVAGCPSVIASHWDVADDVTLEFMLAFYKALKVPKTRIDDAVRFAQSEVKRNHPDPFNWAAFELIGDANPVTKG